jgi:hypothetical protein
MMRIRDRRKIIRVVQQDTKPSLLKKKSAHRDLPLEPDPAIPLTLILHKFYIGRTLLGRTLQGGNHQQ